MPVAPLKNPRVIEGIHVLTLFALAVAQPLFALLGKQVGFFTANQFDGLAIVLLTVLIFWAIPVAFVLLKELLGLFRPTRQLVRFGMQSVYMVSLISLLVLPALKRVDIGPNWLPLLLAGLIGMLASLLYWHKEALRSFLTFLWPVVLIFPLIFLFFSKTTPILFGQQDSSFYHPEKQLVDTNRAYPPVVFVIWDELPTSTLLDENRQIDAMRYPHFAELASQATWFSNVHTVGASTIWAVPALLSGQMPTHEEKHTPQQLEVNLFTLLGQTHRMSNVAEKHTVLCPRVLCKRGKTNYVKKLTQTMPDLAAVYLHTVLPPTMTDWLPDVSNNWGEFTWGRPKMPTGPLTEDERQQLAVQKQRINNEMAVPNHKRNLFFRFLKRMKPYQANEKPALDFMHIVFPHVPYNYMPSGKYYSTAAYKYFTTWHNEREIYYDYQRHLLQMGALDELMGHLIQRLKDLGLYDKAIIVVTADHGASWASVGTERRKLTPTNYQNLIQVPLFIKMPGQTQAKRIERPMLTIDIVPTLADLMKLPRLEKMDGHSVFSPNYPDFKQVRVMDNLGEHWHTFPLVSAAQQAASLQRKVAWFGSGASQHIFTKTPVFSDLIGKPLKQLPVSPPSAPSPWHFSLETPENYQSVDLNGQFIPAQVEGWVQTQQANVFPKDIAIAVNNVVWATFPYLKQDQQRLRFEAMVPEESFQNGRNTIRLFAITQNGEKPQLTEIKHQP